MDKLKEKMMPFFDDWDLSWEGSKYKKMPKKSFKIAKKVARKRLKQDTEKEIKEVIRNE